jgi:hypothetical protein
LEYAGYYLKEQREINRETSINKKEVGKTTIKSQQGA